MSATDTERNETVSFDVKDGLGYLTIDNPPVNALSRSVIIGMRSAFDAFADSDAAGLIVLCRGRTFIAGGDLEAFEDPDFTAEPLNKLLADMEASDRPIAAVMHGTVLGGGLEVAMACHGRFAQPGTRFGMPEITIGLIPGSLGTQRLPRLVGLAKAAEMINTGKPIDAEEARNAGLIDEIADDATASAVAFIRSQPKEKLRRVSQLRVADAEQVEDILAPYTKSAEAAPFLPAREGAVRALRAAATETYDAGETVERDIFAALVKSSSSRALRHLFFAERAAQRIADLPAGVTSRPVGSVGIVGAGTMGSGIAIAFADADYPVTLVDASEEALDRGLARIQQTYEKQAERGRLDNAEAQRRRKLVTGGTDLQALSQCDLVIEAVFEDMALKKDVISRLASICRSDAILATNTSTLDVDEIAAASGRPNDVLGTHFFSPANIMRLLEVVRGEKTAPDVLKTVMEVARKIRKTAVVTGVCYGFIGNRMAEVYMRESEAMQMEGSSPARIDGVVEDPRHLGLAMGPSRMLDMAGVDVGARTVIEWIKSGAGPQAPAYRALSRTLFEKGWHGQKTGQGYYLYEGRTPKPSPETEALTKTLAQKHDVAPREHSDQEILERLLYSMINEAALILEEGIAQRASDIDVVWTAGYGFPAWRGGPLFMADNIGADAIVAAMNKYAEALGNDDGRWTPAPLLERMAREGGRFSDIGKDQK